MAGNKKIIMFYFQKIKQRDKNPLTNVMIQLYRIYTSSVLIPCQL
jgi:hypothetical protein